MMPTRRYRAWNSPSRPMLLIYACPALFPMASSPSSICPACALSLGSIIAKCLPTNRFLSHCRRFDSSKPWFASALMACTLNP
ncbi:hypothetical protein BCR44DRAFT_1432461 [Catenaria anguillulae PL171]|uniref:Uncharacterized protein n=1 Tax=Catenaria anguillulae PL171 TaxID=765915 RepID=A0A1Y2HR72_9FUNG|nr:hypothetical protein BCR44DRAFT_1432461 [Catenaria anguillulae PL171]